MDRPTYIVELTLDPDRLEAFEAYEAKVLPLLTDHGGSLDQRWRNIAGTHEFHLISFETEDGLEGYLADPRRAALSGQWQATAATGRVHRVKNIPTI